MEFDYLRGLSRRDLELQKQLQLKLLEYSVVFEKMLLEEKGLRYIGEIRNLALDKINFINQLLKELPDDDT
jgi:hypothetical protein